MVFFWIAFIVLILTLLVMDLAVVNRKAHAIRMRVALAWTLFYASLALAFCGFVYFMFENHWAGAGKSFGHELDGSIAMDAAIDLFSGRSMAEVSTSKERRKLKRELEHELEELYHGDVMGVYFTEYVTQ